MKFLNGLISNRASSLTPYLPFGGTQGWNVNRLDSREIFNILGIIQIIRSHNVKGIGGGDSAQAFNPLIESVGRSVVNVGRPPTNASIPASKFQPGRCVDNHGFVKGHEELAIGDGMAADKAINTLKLWILVVGKMKLSAQLVGTGIQGEASPRVKLQDFEAIFASSGEIIAI